MWDIHSTFYTKIKVSGIITLRLRTDDSYTRVNYGVVREPVVPVLSETTYMDRSIRSIHPSERKIVPHHTRRYPF